MIDDPPKHIESSATKAILAQKTAFNETAKPDRSSNAIHTASVIAENPQSGPSRCGFVDVRALFRTMCHSGIAAPVFVAT